MSTYVTVSPLSTGAATNRLRIGEGINKWARSENSVEFASSVGADDADSE